MDFPGPAPPPFMLIVQKALASIQPLHPLNRITMAAEMGCLHQTSRHILKLILCSSDLPWYFPSLLINGLLRRTKYQLYSKRCSELYLRGLELSELPVDLGFFLFLWTKISLNPLSLMEERFLHCKAAESKLLDWSLTAEFKSIDKELRTYSVKLRQRKTSRIKLHCLRCYCNCYIEKHQ